jgi:S-adenosyl methyltransferase
MIRKAHVDSTPNHTGGEYAPTLVDTSRPHPARMYDAYLGGKDNYAADRAAVEHVLATVPEIRDIALANRAFMRRVVRRLAKEKGISQFLDIGTGIPTSPNVHEVAAEYAPGARVVYVDNDPIVHAHANALLTGTGATKIVLADLRDPRTIIAEALGFLDFTRPIALLLVAILHFLPNEDDPAGIVATLRDALPAGSWLALSHGTTDFHPAEVTTPAAAAYDTAPAPLVLRPCEQIEAFFDGFILESPGIVQAPLWHPDTRRRPKDLMKIGIYAGAAVKN